ncbi:zf-HC2 domain-containing protein [Corynebacterium poyangense]|uniref:zf-HC2 domain-containing protein n=1 Tax=Corynebacterium poyangense TaxID=2684405 RepID=UPI00165D06D0|nr:zf-HC2 domain-containing protein [Corynebacterium poyangense]
MLDCEQIQAAISARLDGEPTGIPDDVIDAHVAACPECRAYQEKILLLHEKFSFKEDPVALAVSQGPRPDLADSILADAEPQLRKRATTRALGLALTRVALCILAIAYVGWAVTLLARSTNLSPEDPNNAFVVEAAALRVALAVGLIFGAWWPRLVVGMLPVIGTFFMFSAGLGMRDFVLGQASEEQWLQLVMLFISLLVLLWSWLNNYGLDAFRRYWLTLGSGSAGP